tara:strand:+ start:3359 stop:4444 length:1086 start_codon:yes stop_codon:yes gene_type:complete
MYKYTKKVILKSGTVWKFLPPQDAIDSGVVKRQTFSDGRAARYEIPRLVQIVESFRCGEIVAGNIGPTSTILQIYKYYVTTTHFKQLAYNSQKTYDSSMDAISNTKIGSKTLGSIKIKDLTALHCTEAYKEWCESVSVSKGNQCSRIFSLLINFCISIDLIKYNPMSRIRKRKHESRSTIWTQEQVEQFLDVAFKNFDWRNVGLIVLMCYEWAQRPTDIRLLKWNSINFKECKVKIKQTKRGATVELPISNEIMEMLNQQKKDWDFQEYVVPHQRPSDGAYRPLNICQVSALANEVKVAGSMPSDLRVGDLRKSAIVEMIDAEVDHLAIMSVTGHQNISSLNPYHKHTYAAAKSALDRRKK